MLPGAGPVGAAGQASVEAASRHSQYFELDLSMLIEAGEPHFERPMGLEAGGAVVQID